MPEGVAGNGRGGGVGESGAGARNAAAGAASGSAMDHCEPARFPRWNGDGTAARSGDPATGNICADSRSGAGRAAESGAMGASSGVGRSEGARFGDCACGAGGSAASSPDCLFRRTALSRAVFGAQGPGRKAHTADRRHRIHRQGVAGEHLDGSTRDRETLFADTPAEVESGAAALREDDRGLAGFRSVV